MRGNYWKLIWTFTAIVWLRLYETPGLGSGVPVTTAGTEPCAKQAEGDEAPPSGHQKLAVDTTAIVPDCGAVN